MAAQCNWQMQMVNIGWTVSAHPDVHLEHLPSRQLSAPASPSSSNWINSRAARAVPTWANSPARKQNPQKTQHSQWGLQLLCNALVKISTWICLCQHQSYSRVGTAKTQSPSAETQMPSTLQNNLYEKIRISVTLKWQNINPIRVSLDLMLYFYYTNSNWKKKIREPHCSHILEGVTMFHKSTQTTESLSPFYTLNLPGNQRPLGLRNSRTFANLTDCAQPTSCPYRETQLSAPLSP